MSVAFTFQADGADWRIGRDVRSLSRKRRARVSCLDGPCNWEGFGDSHFPKGVWQQPTHHSAHDGRETKFEAPAVVCALTGLFYA